MTSPTASQPVQLSNKNYDRLKTTAQLLLPALATLYFGVAQIWGLPAAEEVVGTVAIVNTFAGVAVAWLKSLHNASGAQYDGTFITEVGEEGTTFHLGSVDQNALFDKDELRFKIIRPKQDPDIKTPAY